MIDTSASQLVALDTSIAVAATVIGARRHIPARQYCESLKDSGAIVCFSTLLRIEFLHALVGIANDPGQLIESTRRKARLHRWGDFPEARREWLSHWSRELDALITIFDSYREISFDSALIPAIGDLMAELQLKSYDATHLASALAVGADTFATLDSDFETDAISSSIGISIHVVR